VIARFLRRRHPRQQTHDPHNRPPVLMTPLAVPPSSLSVALTHYARASLERVLEARDPNMGGLHCILEGPGLECGTRVAGRLGQAAMGWPQRLSRRHPNEGGCIAAPQRSAGLGRWCSPAGNRSTPVPCSVLLAHSCSRGSVGSQRCPFPLAPPGPASAMPAPRKRIETNSGIHPSDHTDACDVDQSVRLWP
jgi:hypothetical protein